MRAPVRAPRAGMAVPFLLLVLVVTALAAAGAGWTALALRRAEHSAAVTDRRWHVADSLLRTVPCVGPLSPGASQVWTRGTGDGPAMFRLRHAEGACWLSVAVGDTLPVVGAFLTVQDSAVTLQASASPVGLPSIDASTELPPRSFAMVPGPTPVAPPPLMAWRDLR